MKWEAAIGRRGLWRNQSTAAYAQDDTTSFSDRKTAIQSAETNTPSASPTITTRTTQTLPSTLAAPQRLESEVFRAPKPQNIHIVGTEKLGSFVAHALSRMVSAPAITLLLHQPHKFQQWFDEGKSIEYLVNGESDFRDGFNVEYSHLQYAPDPRADPLTGFERSFGYLRKKEKWAINMLVVTTPTSSTVAAIAPLAQRLGPGSTICFINHSFATMDHVNAMIFPDPSRRPRYILGISSHALWPTARNFGVLHHQPSKGHLILSAVPSRQARMPEEDSELGTEASVSASASASASATSDHLDTPDDPVTTIQGGEELETQPNFNESTEQTNASTAPLKISRMQYGWTASSTALMKTLTRCETLSADGIPYDVMIQKQWERLVIDSVINPLSVVFDCKYGKLTTSGPARRLIKALVSEAVEVIHYLPEFRMVPDEIMRKKFSVHALGSIINHLLLKLGGNISTMLKDVREGRRTDINYLNGYIIRRGREVGVNCPVHQTIMDQVRAKQGMNKNQIEGYIPFR